MAATSGLDTLPIGDAGTTCSAGEALLVTGAGLLMLWPALYNGFPLIFSDTGTYISQAMEFHLGWDRPPYYSFFILALGWGRSLWPPVIVQCIAAAWLIRRTQRMIAPRAGLLAGAALLAPLAVLTSLPWTAAQIMPDIFTPMMVLAFAILVLDADCTRRERRVLMAITGLAIMVHLSNLPIYAGLCLTVLGTHALFHRKVSWRKVSWRKVSWRKVSWRVILLPLVIGVSALIGVNVVASGRFAVSPFGATFVLARLLNDGPARTTLARDCPVRHWALCKYQGRMPRTADSFLWRADSPLYRAGGPVTLIDQTQAIVAQTIETEPGPVLRDAVRDFARQLVTFAPGSGLRPWYATAWQTIKRDFAPPTVDAFTHSLQARGRLRVPGLLMTIAQTLATLGIGVTGGFVAIMLLHRAPALLCDDEKQRPESRLFALSIIVLLALLGNAAVTGTLSGPHDRYQSRVVWLAVLSGSLVLGRVYSAWRSRPINRTA